MMSGACVVRSGRARPALQMASSVDNMPQPGAAEEHETLAERSACITRTSHPSYSLHEHQVSTRAAAATGSVMTMQAQPALGLMGQEPMPFAAVGTTRPSGRRGSTIPPHHMFFPATPIFFIYGIKKEYTTKKTRFTEGISTLHRAGRRRVSMWSLKTWK
jgi:hypothetical protein